jgi:riboflavin synthase
MFTGIIQDIGVVAGIVKDGDWLLTIEPRALPLAQTSIGASIACSGVCLTVVAKADKWFQVQTSTETLDKTTIKNWQSGTHINLEPALRMGDPLGGHLVSGHVDGVGRVITTTKEQDSLRLQFEAPQDMARFLAAKGSVTIDGVSLTVNDVEGARFTVNIIPHTQSATTLGKLATGDAVNFEADMMARYADRLLHPQ